MLKMIIADDEPIILDGITQSIDWGSFGIQVAGAAKNGIEALEIARKSSPDIILTDIKMPGLSGLDFIRELKKVKSDFKIILISAYEQFSFAQEAISLGVLSYITKPLKKQKIIEEVTKARDQILEERRDRENLEKLEALYKSNLPLLQEQYYNKLIMGKTRLSGDYRRQVPDYEMAVDDNKEIGVLVLTLDNMEETSEDYFEKSVQILLLRMAEMVKALLPPCYKRTVFQSYNNEVVAIYNIWGSREETIRQVAHTAEEIKNALQKELGLSISGGLGRIRPLLSQVSLSYREAVKALNYRLVYGNNTVLYIDHVEINAAPSDFLLNDLNDFLSTISNILRTGKAQEVMTQVDRRLSSVINAKNLPYYYVQQIYCQLLSALLGALYEMSLTPEEIYGTPVHLYGELFKKHTLEEMSRWYRDLVERTCFVINVKKAQRINHVIEMAVAYIRENCNRDLSLGEVAEHVNLNPSYMSRLFKEETGIPFIEYVRNVKMDMAKELLRLTNKKIYEIGEELGYQNVQYFSTLFKSSVGMTPVEYKKSGPPMFHGRIS